MLKLAQNLSYKLPKVYIPRIREKSTSTSLKAALLSDEVSDLTQIKNSAVSRISLTDQGIMQDETCKTENSSELNLISDGTDSSSSHLKQKFYEDTDKFSICNINTLKNVLSINKSINDHYKNDNCNDINTNLKIFSTESHTKVKNLIDFTDRKIDHNKKEVRFLNVNENNKDQVNMTSLNDEKNLESTCNVSPDSETLNKSIIEATEARKPLVRSVVEGNFLPINNGFITKITEPLNWKTIDEIPIIIMNGPIEPENEENIALYPSFEYELLPSSATLGENNDYFASNNKDSEIDGFQDKTVSSITKRDDETLTSNNSVKNFSLKYDQCSNQSDEDPNDPNYEVGDSEDVDYDSEYSDSHISELEELDDFEEPEDLRKDSIVRDDLNTSADLNFDLSSIQLQESRVNDLDIDSNDKQNEVLDDEQVSEPLLFDNSRKLAT